MNVYKLRAECLIDISLFISRNTGKVSPKAAVKWEELPDHELEFESELSLEEIIRDLCDQEDAHVMYQTVQLLENYTGERDYIRGFEAEGKT